MEETKLIKSYNLLVYFWDGETIRLEMIPGNLKIYNESPVLKAVITIEEKYKAQLNSDVRIGTALDSIYRESVDLAEKYDNLENYKIVKIVDEEGKELKEYIIGESTPYYNEEFEKRGIEVFKQRFPEEIQKKFIEEFQHKSKQKSKYWKSID